MHCRREFEMFLFRKVLGFAIFLVGLALQDDARPELCPKHILIHHNIKPKYYLDMAETIEVWVKIVPEPWQDNRLIGGVSNPTALSFNLSCVQQETDFKGVVTRNLTAVIFQPEHLATGNSFNSIPNRLNITGEFEFYIQPFSENGECDTLKVMTKIIVGCPVHRRLQIHGQKFEGCDEFKDFNYTIPREQSNESSRVVHYDLQNLGCPITSIIHSHFKPTVHVYDDDQFVAEVTGDFIMWEKHGQNSYHYSMTMQQAGCIGTPQDWSDMIENLKASQVDQVYKEKVHHSCFNGTSSSNAEHNLDMPYEVMNNTGGSALIWDEGGLYIFKLRIIDPEVSFCDLTAEFAIKVVFTVPPPEEVPTFIVLGASCLGILLGTLAAYLIDSHCL